METKKEIRMICSPEIFERIERQAANLGQKPGSFARQIIMEKVVELEMKSSNQHALKIMEVLQKMEEKER